jgi:hypothetical protein
VEKMSNSIIGKLFLCNEERDKKTIECLQKLGFTHDKYNKKNIDYLNLEDVYIIEFKEKPFILKTLEYNNFFDKKEYLSISKISEYGICIYVAGPEFGDGHIFLPMDNITCIHTIEKEQITDYIQFILNPE